MVRIVSGQQRDPNIALLQGMQIGQQYRQAQRQREDDERAQMDQLLQMRRLKMQLDAEQLKQEQFLSQQSQMGNAQAIQKIALRQRMSPGEKRSEAAMQLLEGITDPKARAIAIPALKGLLDEEEQQDEIKAFEESLKRAGVDGLLDPSEQPTDTTKPRDPGALPTVGDYRARQQSGEDISAMSKELFNARVIRAKKAAHEEDNVKFLEQMHAAIEAAPPGRERTDALIAYNEYKASPSRLGEEGSGAKVLAAVREALMGPVTRAAVVEESNKAWAENKPAPGLQGMSAGERNAQMMREPTLGFGGPKIPPFAGGTHATVRGTNRKAPPQDDDLGKLLSSATNPQELAEKLNSAGIPKTPENMRAIQERIRALSGR